MEEFTSGEQSVERGFTEWAGLPYTGPRIPPLRQLSLMNFTPLIQKRAYCYDDLREWGAIVGGLYDDYHRRLRPKLNGDPKLQAAEDGHADKMLVNWRALGYGRLVFASDFTSRSTEQADQLKKAVERRSDAYIAWLSAQSESRLRSMFLGTKIKLNKGKGAPYWQAGTDRGAGLLLAMLGRKVQDLDVMREMLSADAGGAPMLMTMFMRIQAARKATTRKRFVGGRLFADGEMIACKVRTVKAPPFAENNVVAGVFDMLKEAATSIWPRRHLTNSVDASRIAGGYTHLLATDLSTADDRIGLELLALIRDVTLTRVLDHLVARNVIEPWLREYTLAYDRLVAERQILAPARSLEERACLLNMTGGVKSGERGTTWKDLEVVAARCDVIIEWMRAQHGVRADYMSWGDDVLVMSDSELTAKLWFEQDVATALWSEKADDDSSYLGRRMPQGYTYFMRMVARRVNREPAEEPTSALGAALSVSAARDTLQGHPLAEEFVPLLQQHVPRLRTALTIANSSDTLTLMRLYNTAITTVEPRQIERALLEDGGIDDEFESGQFGGRAIYSKKLERDVPAEVTEADIRASANEFSIDDIRHRLRRKIT